MNKDKIEMIQVGIYGRSARKLLMKPTGFAGMFWSADYWFDSKTGDFLKYKRLKGPPGTPEFTIKKKF